MLVQKAHPEEKQGRITPVHAEHGSYLQYIPSNVASTPDIIILAHGTPDKGKSAFDMAEIYIGHWVDFAEETGAIVLSVAFDQHNYGSIEGGDLGGYRSLMGRTINADAFVEEIVDYYRSAFAIDDERFYLYGHSAGGQFVARYSVTHPERVKGAVISAAGRYPYPDPSVAWPFGMGRLQTPFQWDENEPEIMLDIQPDPSGWVEAAGLPVVVVVGLNDTEPQYADPGQQGSTRLRNGSAWVRAMNAYAEENSGEGNMRFSVVAGRGHSAIGIMPFCQEELKAILLQAET
ncbi:MAG: alpha/beta fold hydrolase [Anaerolineae bacterium]|nr:alpha/beta fold hydrolase [Anaerolineae bacterium]